jgi:hypothetical protein
MAAGLEAEERAVSIMHVCEIRPRKDCAEMSPKCPSSSFIGGKRLQPRGEVWRLSQRLLVDESSP